VDKLKSLLAESIKIKFKYQFNTELYYVAAILLISKIDFWYEQPFAQDLIRKGLKYLKGFGIKFLFVPPKNESEPKEQTNKDFEPINLTQNESKSQEITKKFGNFLKKMCSNEKSTKIDNAASLFNFEYKFIVEIKRYDILI
jgi:hypothetical protein